MCDDLHERAFMFFSGPLFVADMVEIDVKLFRQILQMIVIADHGPDVNRKGMGVMPDQEVAKAMAFAGGQYDNVFLPFRDKFDIRSGRKDVVQPTSDGVWVHIARELGPHEKAVAFFFNKLPIVHDVEVMFIKEPRDIVYQSFAVVAGDEENIGGHWVQFR